MSYSVLSKYRTELMGAAMLWVMLFHCYWVDLVLPPLDFLRHTGFGGVDIFILLSAMGLAMSLERREQEYTAFMGRRAGRILPAYFTVMIPYTLWKIIEGAAPWSALLWNSSLLYYWVHSAGAFNWYVAAIMTFYAVTPACAALYRRCRRRELLTAAGTVLGVGAAALLIHDGYWNHLDIFYRIPVFFMGMLMGRYVLEDRRLGVKDWVFWTLWLAAGAIFLLIRQRSASLQLCFLFVFTTVPACLLAGLLFEKLPLGWLRRGLRVVGRSSLEIYLLNVSIFSETELLWKIFDFDSGHYIFLVISFALNIAGGVLLHRAIELIRGRLKKESGRKTAETIK